MASLVNGLTQPLEPISTSTTSTARSTSTLNNAASMINRGGIGHAPNALPIQITAPTPPQDIVNVLNLYEQSFLPSGRRSLSGIALRAFVLGMALCSSLTLSIHLLAQQQAIWRAPFFIASLSLFHFLEFWTTSTANTSKADVASFLLSSNGVAYNIAHASALLECLLSHSVLSAYLPALPSAPHGVLLFAGLALMGVGQIVRVQAMLTAGQSFSHIVAHTKKETHALITTGVYKHLRHPSYFGYFWWAIGTQLMCGNTICLLGYTVVLQRFFRRRISGEEELLIKFFGDEYVKYRASSWVGIPFIR